MLSRIKRSGKNAVCSGEEGPVGLPLLHDLVRPALSFTHTDHARVGDHRFLVVDHPHALHPYDKLLRALGVLVAIPILPQPKQTFYISFLQVLTDFDLLKVMPWL